MTTLSREFQQEILVFRAFNLTVSTEYAEADISRGRKLNKKYRADVRRSLESFLLSDSTLDGTEVQRHWFPQVDANVFISHAHRDNDIALGISGWLSQEFGLKPFVDSCVWGHADDLLKSIDDEFCLNPGGETYSYERRNGSTSHVHMMLSTALQMMIDSTECVIFLNTPNSIKSQDSIAKTLSPWLFMEIGMTRLVRRKSPEQHRTMRTITKSRERLLKEAKMKIEYDVSLISLTDITELTLNRWQRRCAMRDGHPLDQLYELAGPE